MSSITVPSKREDTLYSILGTLLLLALWQLLSMFGGTGFLLPAPSAVLATFFRLFASKDNWISIFTSVARIVSSLLVAIVFAILLSWLASKRRALRKLLAPTILIMKSVPIVSFILIALFFMKESLLTSFICGLIVFPMVYGQLLSAFLNVDSRLIEMGRVFSFRKSEIVRYIVVPECREPFLASVAVAVGMAWKAGVAAEVLTFASGTIGKQMYEAKLYLDMERLLAWTLALVLASFVSEQVLVRVFRFILTRVGDSLPGDMNLSRTRAQQRQKEIVKNLKTRTELLEEQATPRGDELVEEPSVCPVEGQAILIRGVLCVNSLTDDGDVSKIVIDQVSKCFGSAYVFSDYCATIPLDRPLVIIGPSGVGKTTLMRMIAGLIRPDTGEITGVPERGVFVFQDNRLLPQLSARDNIRLVLPGYDGEWADNLLASLDLKSVKDQPASTLSGGEMRRLALARALAVESDIFYLDEAFRELDEMHENEALNVLLQVAKGKPIILATHDLSLIDRLNANILELKK